MASSDTQTSARRFYLIASIAIVVTGLYLARELLIPLALAIFLTFLLAPLATRLERFGLGKIPGTLASIALALIIILGLVFMVTDQLISLANRLPEYQGNIQAKIQEAEGATARVMGRLTESLRGITQPLGKPETATSPGPTIERLADAEMARRIAGRFQQPSVAELPGGNGTTADPLETEPLPVRIVQPPDTPLSYIRKSAPSLLGPLGTAGIVVVLAIFMLLKRRDLRDRLITLTGRGKIFVTTQALDEVSRRISRYLLMQLVVNTSYAVPVSVGLALFGIPNALLWGVMGLFLRFIPYVGAWFTAGVSVLLAIAVLPGWWGPLGVLIFFVVLELIINNAVEPFVYSSGTGISVLGVIFSAVFWAWIWGPVGLILATPIAVCLTVIGKHIPQLEFLGVLLGGEATLEPKLRFVQRLLALDREEAMEIAEEYRKSKSLLGLYDELIVPALQMVEQERHRGQIDEAQSDFLNRAFHEIIDESAQNEAEDREEEAARASGGEAPVSGASSTISTDISKSTRIMCLPAGDQADELAGLMLQDLLEAQGYQVQTASVESLSSELLAEVEEKQSQIVFISALPPGALVGARYLCKRVSARWPGINVLIGLWNATGNVGYARERLESCGKTKVVTSYASALAEVARIAQSIQLVT